MEISMSNVERFAFSSSGISINISFDKHKY